MKLGSLFIGFLGGYVCAVLARARADVAGAIDNLTNRVRQRRSATIKLIAVIVLVIVAVRMKGIR